MKKGTLNREPQKIILNYSLLWVLVKFKNKMQIIKALVNTMKGEK